MSEIPLFKHYFSMFRNYAVFSGRTDRGEFWWAVGMHTIIMFIIRFLSQFLSLLAGAAHVPMTLLSAVILLLISVYSLATVIPLTALTVRRLHDADRSGWWLLLSVSGIGSILLLIWLCREGTEDTNLFGSDPHPIRQY